MATEELGETGEISYCGNQGKKHIGFTTKEAWEDPPEELKFSFSEVGKVGGKHNRYVVHLLTTHLQKIKRKNLNEYSFVHCLIGYKRKTTNEYTKTLVDLPHLISNISMHWEKLTAYGTYMANTLLHLRLSCLIDLCILDLLEVG